jgi:hypothetical protein
MTNHYVYSTLAADVNYTRYIKPKVVAVPGQTSRAVDLPIVEKAVLIKGGSGVAPVGMRKLETPYGIMTKVTEEELELLNANEVFQTHLKNGYIQVRKGKVNPEVAVTSGMESRDVSAPIIEADMVKVGNLDEEGKKSKGTGRFTKNTLKNTLQ